jgi:hypothetical protein
MTGAGCPHPGHDRLYFALEWKEKHAIDSLERRLEGVGVKEVPLNCFGSGRKASGCRLPGHRPYLRTSVEKLLNHMPADRAGGPGY